MSTSEKAGEDLHTVYHPRGRCHVGERGPLPDLEEEQRGNAPPPPDYLTDIAAEKWEEHAPALYRLGLLEPTDMDMLATYCRAWVHVQAIESQLNGVYTVDGAKGNTVSPPPLDPAHGGDRPVAQRCQSLRHRSRRAHPRRRTTRRGRRHRGRPVEGADLMVNAEPQYLVGDSGSLAPRGPGRPTRGSSWSRLPGDWPRQGPLGMPEACAGVAQAHSRGRNGPFA